jgi:uncharacterized integral membrane protein
MTSSSGDPTAYPTSPPDELLVPPVNHSPQSTASAPGPGLDGKGHVQRTKTSAVWVGLIAAAIVLIALLIFIGQNSKSVTVHYLGANGRVPLAIALLLSSVAGLLIAAIPGTVRILQLRRAIKKTAESH